MVYLEPDIDSGIASVSPICGCTGGCVYCYIDIKGYNAPQMNSMKVNQVKEFLMNANGFISGKEGTFICVGTWGEVFPFKLYLKKESFKWIEELTILQNPIVIITKKTLNKQEIEEIKSFQKYDGQITFLLSITSLMRWKELEPGTSPAMDRLEMGKLISEEKMNIALFINPFLKSITDIELDFILEKCVEKTIRNVIISPLYLNSVICNKNHLCPAFQKIVSSFSDNNFENCNHMRNDEYEVVEDPIDDYMDDIMKKCKIKEIYCWFHYSCFLSNLYRRINGSQKGKKFCIRCGNCIHE